MLKGRFGAGMIGLFLAVAVTLVPVAPAAAAVPTATPQTHTIDEDTSLTGSMTFSDPDGDDIASGTYASPLHGSLSSTIGTGAPSATITFSYTPDADFFGVDVFDFQVTDERGETSAIVAVTVHVTPVDDGYAADADSFTGDEDTVVTGNVLDNDSDPDGDVTVSIDTPPTIGTIDLQADGSFAYTPEPDWNGTDTFAYQGTDGTATDSAQVTVTVLPVNDDPVAQAATFTGDEGSPVAGTFTATDVDDDALTYAVETPPGRGTVSSLDATTGDFTYQPDPGFSGSDSLEFSATDDDGGSHTATITFDLNGAPTITRDAFVLDEDEAVTIDARELVADPDHTDDLLSYTIGAAPTKGIVTDGVHGGSFVYTPEPDFSGSDSFALEVCDPEGICDTETVDLEVVPVNDAPTVADATVVVDEDGVASGDLVVVDVDDTTFDYSIATPPKHGTATAGSFTYEPDPDFHGGDTFAITVCDSGDLCATATIDVTVEPVNDSPTADGDTTRIEAAVGDTAVLSSPFTDPDGDTLTHEWRQQTGAPLRIDDTESASIEVHAVAAGTYTFAVTACDPSDACDSADIVLSVREHEPRPTATPAMLSALPLTGTPIAPLVGLGFMALAVGIAFTARSRRT